MNPRQRERALQLCGEGLVTLETALTALVRLDMENQKLRAELAGRQAREADA